jgi:two-component system sensor histidine kinase KdpD
MVEPDGPIRLTPICLEKRQLATSTAVWYWLPNTAVRVLPRATHQVRDYAEHESEAAALRRSKAVIKGDRWRQKLRSQQAGAIVASTVAVAIATLAGRLFSAMAPLPNISMVFLLAVLFSAVSFGMRLAVYASVVSFLAYDFFFIEPLYTFQITEPSELLSLITFLIVAIVTSALAGRIRDQAAAATERMIATTRLYEFTWKLSGLTSMDAVADGAAGEIYVSLRRPAVILLNRNGELCLAAAWPPEDSLEPAAWDAARLAFARNEPAGLNTELSPVGKWHFIPLRTQRGSFGVVGIASSIGDAPFDAQAHAVLGTLAEQTAAAFDRVCLADQMMVARSAAETERVRNILLASVSHDFRTPLASILGSATSLLDFGARLEADARTGLLREIKAEAEALDEMVRNLLAMTRIDAGGLELRRDWVDLREVIERVINAARRRGAALAVVLELPPALALIRADASLIEQAVGNVVNNVVAHAPPGTRLAIDAVETQQSLSIRVTDNGPGIQAEIMPRVFEKFVQGRIGNGRNSKSGGTGLGLAIAKGIVEAHGGSIAAESPVADGRGARLTLTFPREQAP